MKVNIKKLEKAIKTSWNKKTCHPDGVKKWSKRKSFYGQCGVTTLLIQEFFGGKIGFNKKLRHVWNILPDGSKYDLTKDQFPKGTIIRKDGFISRNNMFNNKLAIKARVKQRYKIFKKRVLERLRKK